MTSPSTLLAIPDKFRQTALAFPVKVQQAVALLNDPEELQEMLAKADAMTAYTRHLRQSTEVNNALQVARLYIQDGVGRVMPPKQGSGGGRGRRKKTSGGSPPKFSDDAVKQFRKVHRNASRLAEYQQKIEAYNSILPDDSPDALQVNTTHFLRYCGSDGVLCTKHGNGVVDWYTPEKYVSLVRKAMGGIDCDPATSKCAQDVVQAKTYYTANDDGLAQEWEGRVFLNPPYKMPDVAKFVNKLCDGIESKSVAQAVLLTNNNTDTDWWQRAASLASCICLTDGRISFYNAVGDESSPTNGQSFCYFGRREAAFRKAFEEVGVILCRT